MTATEPTAVHSTFTIERSFPLSPARVFSAFAQPDFKRRWYCQGDHEIQDFRMDFRAGGSERFAYRFKEGHPIAGSEIANEGMYHDIVEEMRIVMTSRMSLNGKPIAVMLAAFEFVPAGSGNATDLILTHRGTYLDWPDGVKMIEAGWNQLIHRLQKELEQ